jgi:very-short-patch-repair endonuclease
MDTEQKSRILAVAAEQHGLFARHQAIAAGLSRGQIQTLERNGTATRLDRNVWIAAGAPFTDDARALAAVLRHGHGAVLTCHSAAWVWRVPGHGLEPVEVLRARDEHLPAEVRSRTSRCLDERDVTIRRGIPVTTPARTLFDLAGRQHPQRTRQDLNNLMSRRLLRLHHLDEALDRLAAQGRDGITLMRALISEAHERGEPAGSNLELVVEDLLAAAGFRHMQRQVPVYDAQGFIARVDFGDRRRRVAVEVDSDRFHSGLVDLQLDERKTARLERIDWTVVRISEREVWWERETTLGRLRKALWSSTPRLESAS